MTDLMHPQVSPSPGARTARPFDAVEVDEHVDCDRIWATILQARDDLERYEDAAKQRVTDAEQGEWDARAALEADPPRDLEEIEAAFNDLVASGYKRKKFERLRRAIQGS